VRAALILLLAAGCGTKVVDLAPADAGAGMAAQSCFAKPSADVRCVYCGANLEQRACLKCDGVGGQSVCRLCQWSDQEKSGSPCKLCYDDRGAILDDDCDQQRTDLPHD
jgi:hypothetical protein